MRFFFSLLLFLIIFGSLAILGNMLRCASISKNTICPTWCLARKVQCLTEDCETQFACRPPGLAEYVGLVETWVEEQEQRFIKK